MRTLRNHYLREFLRLFLIICIGISLTFSLVELINNIQDLMPHKPPLGDLLLYAALNIPKYILYLMPMAALISSLFVFGQASRRKETVAIRASGGSMKLLFMPLVLTGAMLSILALIISEFIAPDFLFRAHRLKDRLTMTESVFKMKEGKMWMRTKDAIVKVDLYLPHQAMISGITIMRIEDDMLTERIEAESAEWKPTWRESETEKGGVWQLRGVTVYDIAKGTITKYPELSSAIIDSPDFFRSGIQKPEEMNIRELIVYTKKLKDAGFRNTKLLVDIHSKISYPLINAIMLVLGLALSTRGVTGSGLIVTAIGICISLVYWVGYTTALSLGYAGILSPLMAAWFLPTVFGVMAYLLFMQVPE